MARNDLRDTVQDALGQKQDVQRVWFGVLGDADGTVIVPGKVSYVYVTLPDGMPVEAYNTSVPTILNLPVVIGFDPKQRRSDLLRVLDIRDTPRQGNTAAAYFVDKHHASHEWLNSAGGSDVVYTQLRQFMPLRPSVVEPFGVNIARDVQMVSSTWTEVGGITTDLISYIPTFSGSGALQERFVTLSMSPTSGSITVTSGSVSNIGESSMSLIPAAPTGDYPIAAVRLYTDQPKIIEAQTSTDLIDLRWGVFSSLATLHNAMGGLQGGTSAEYYHLTADEYVVAQNTSGSNTGDQDVPGDHSPVSDFYLTGYDATSGSFSSGSVVAPSVNFAVQRSWFGI